MPYTDPAVESGKHTATAAGDSIGTIAAEMGIDDADVTLRLDQVGFGPEDLERIEAISPQLERSIDGMCDTFFSFLRNSEEAKPMLRDPRIMERVRSNIRTHLSQVTEGRFDRQYALQRIELALLVDGAGLSMRLLFGAYHAMMTYLGRQLIAADEEHATDGFACFVSLKKTVFFDLALIAETLNFLGERVIEAQDRTISELSTPVLTIWDRILALPLIGTLDTERTQEVMETLLEAIDRDKARVVILDISGVPTVDTGVAQHLMKTIHAARLMGAQTVLSGVRPETAQTMAHLGVHLGGIATRGRLADALRTAMAYLADSRENAPGLEQQGNDGDRHGNSGQHVSS